MFWVKFWSFLMGYLALLVEGPQVEKILNMAVSRGIYLWDIQWLGPHRVVLKARVSGFKALRHIIKRTGGRMRIKEKRGLPFKTAKALRRQMMIVGALSCITILYALSSFVWFVEVEGNKKVAATVILKEAEEAGLYVGTAKWKLHSGRVERHIKNELPGLSWVGINVTGTKAVIRVAEKVQPLPNDDQPANIVAGKSGLVEEVLVLAGVAKVTDGDMVEKGETLISGVIETEIEPSQSPNNQKPEEEGENDEKIIKKRFLRARGIVKARVWYEGYGEAQLISVEQVRTGRAVKEVKLKVGSKSITIQGEENIPYRYFTKDKEVKRLPKWRNINFPVEIITTHYYETRKIEKTVGVAEARSMAIQKARGQVDKIVPGDAKLLREKLHIIRTGEKNLVRVKISVETMEDIGQVKPIPQSEMSREFLQNQEVRHN